MFSHKRFLCTTRSSKASKQASKHQNQGGICVEWSQGASKIFLVLHKRFSDKQSLCTTRSSKASKQASKYQNQGGICVEWSQRASKHFLLFCKRFSDKHSLCTTWRFTLYLKKLLSKQMSKQDSSKQKWPLVVIAGSSCYLGKFLLALDPLRVYNLNILKINMFRAYLSIFHKQSVKI